MIRRAFLGRFILRAFGIPTIARPSPGHGALAHWTPSGWVVSLGSTWGKSSTKEKYGKNTDTDFLEHTRARASGYLFKRVIRARLIGDVIGEDRVNASVYHQPAVNWGSGMHFLLMFRGRCGGDKNTDEGGINKCY